MKPGSVLKAVPTIEGAGVHLKRVFGYHHQPLFDPFLLLDDFHGSDPVTYRKGFPWHPHRGIETITLLLHGSVDHGDSLGSNGVINAGDVQWMTAGSGIVHQEMPRGDSTGLMRGLQLWANLPAAQKMTDPKYRDVTAGDIPVVSGLGYSMRVVAGTFNGVSGPVDDIVIDPELFVGTLDPGGRVTHRTAPGYTFFIYLLAGTLVLGADQVIDHEHLVLLPGGEEITLIAGDHGADFLMVSGKPLKEPVAWGGPIVMNTREELRRAFHEYEQGTFLNHTGSGSPPKG